jgi:hypothetical protein
MTCYIVTFQTISEASRNKVLEVLKRYGFYCPIHNYCWAIKTDKKAKDVVDDIRTVLASNERVFVVRSGTEAAWFNSYGEEYSKWLKENL